MDSHPSNSGPDPSRVVSLDDLARELGLLRSRAARGTRSAKVSLEDLASRVGEPKSTIHAYLSGKRFAPSQVLDRIVIALGTTPAEQREWAEAWYRVAAYRDATHRISTASPTRDAVPRQLPMTVENFTGRTEQLAELDELHAEGRSGTITALSGTAGVGKTALAVQWAQTRSERFPDGQLYVDLRGFDPDQPMQPGQALARFLRALGVAGTDLPRELAERAAQYRSLLSGRRMLILLDNARDVEQVRALLPGTPSCSVLVTSRDSLTGLIARHGAHRLELEVLPPAETILLLRALLGRQLELAPRPVAALAELCAGLPLATRIVAELVAGRSGAVVDDLVDELRASTRSLDLFDAGEDPRTAIRAVFSWSYLRLAAPVAQVFRLVGLHPGPDLTPAALASMADISLPEAQRGLGLLSRAHLVQHEHPGRYTMHRLLRAYAGELAVATDPESERWLALNRLLDHYLHGAAQAMDQLYPARRHRRPELPPGTAQLAPFADSSAARGWLDAERANLVAIGLHAGRKGWPRHTIRLAQTIAHYLDSGEHQADGLVLHRAAHSAARACDDRAAEAGALNELGLAHLRLGKLDEISCFQQALGIYLELGDRAGQGRALANLGHVYLRLGRHREALDQYQRHLAIHRETGDRVEQAAALDNLARLHGVSGSYPEAIEQHRQALAIHREQADLESEARCLAELGELFLILGEQTEAVAHHEQALDRYRLAGHRHGPVETARLSLAAQRPGRQSGTPDLLRVAGE